MVNVLQQSSSDCRVPRAGDMEVQDIPNLLKRGHPKPKAQSKCCNLQVAIFQPSFYFSCLHLFIITFTSRATPGPRYPMVSKYGLEPP